MAKSPFYSSNPNDQMFEQYTANELANMDAKSYQAAERRAAQYPEVFGESVQPAAEQMIKSAKEVAPMNEYSYNINKNATAELYKAMPEVQGQYGAANPEALIGGIAPIAAGYAIQKSHGSLNPISIPSAGAAELPPDIQAQQDAYNQMIMAEKFKNLGR